MSHPVEPPLSGQPGSGSGVPKHSKPDSVKRESVANHSSDTVSSHEIHDENAADTEQIINNDNNLANDVKHITEETEPSHVKSDLPVIEPPSMESLKVSNSLIDASAISLYEPTEEEIDIATMEIGSVDEAQKIAEIILQVLEEDLYEARQQGRFGLKSNHLSDPALEKARRKNWLRDNISEASLVSNLSDFQFDLDAPSELELFYEQGMNDFPGRRLRHLSEDNKVDEAVQVKISRPPIESQDRQREMYSQTKEFSRLRRQTAQNEFMRLYPVPENWEKPAPASRTNSLKHMLDQVAQHDPSEETYLVGAKPKYRKSQKERILPPILGNFQKAETYWTGSTFSGDFKDRMFELGTYEYPTYSQYQSEFKNGEIHSKKHFGLVTYPRGDTFEGTWKHGRFIDGEITFRDGLKFEPMGWRYCTAPDRRFFVERSQGVNGIGETRFSDRIEPPKIPHGCYDVGDGVYNPETGLVVNYKGVILRKATEYEHRWIVLNCRKAKLLPETYQACFLDGRTPDCYSRYILRNT